MTSSEGFQDDFKIISKFVFCGFLMKKNVAFTRIAYAVLKLNECLSVELPFQLHLELKLNLLECR